MYVTLLKQNLCCRCLIVRIAKKWNLLTYFTIFLAPFYFTEIVYFEIAFPAEEFYFFSLKNKRHIKIVEMKSG